MPVRFNLTTSVKLINQLTYLCIMCILWYNLVFTFLGYSKLHFLPFLWGLEILCIDGQSKWSYIKTMQVGAISIDFLQNKFWVLSKPCSYINNALTSILTCPLIMQNLTPKSSQFPKYNSFFSGTHKRNVWVILPCSKLSVFYAWGWKLETAWNLSALSKSYKKVSAVVS